MTLSWVTWSRPTFDALPLSNACGPSCWHLPLLRTPPAQVPRSLLLRACFASLASCVAHSLTVALLQLPPWDVTVLPTSSYPIPAQAVRGVLRDLPAYIVSYMTPALYLYLRCQVPTRTRAGWARAQRAAAAGASLYAFCKRMLRGMHSAGIRCFRTARSAAVRNSGLGWSLQPPAGEPGHGAELAVSDGPLASQPASPLCSSAATICAACPGTPAMSLPMQHRRWSVSSPGCGGSFRPSDPARPAWLGVYPHGDPHAGRTASDGLGAAATAHNSTADAASAAAAAAAAPLFSPPRAAAATGPETAVPGHSAVGDAATVGPLYRSRLPGNALVMSCKVRLDVGQCRIQ